MTIAKRERILATTAFVIATIFKVAVPLALLEYKFELFTNIQGADGMKLTGYGIIAVIIAFVYFGKKIYKVISKMRMNYFKGMIVSILEIVPFLLMFMLVYQVNQNAADWLFVTQWMLVSVMIGTAFSRLFDYYNQEASEIERFKRYG